MVCNVCKLDTHPFLPFGNEFAECSFCWYHKENIQNPDRDEIPELMSWIKGSKKRSVYDCIIPVKGDAEDYFVLHKILSCGLTPLVLHCNSYFQNDIGWHNYHNLITQFDVDNRTFNPQFTSYREFVTHALRRVSDIQLPIRLLRHRYAFETAKELGIPFVIYGKCDPAHYVGKFPHSAQLRMSNWWVNEHEMDGKTLDYVLSSGAQLSDSMKRQYLFPDLREQNKPIGIFLENFMYWDQIKFNGLSLDYGFVPEQQSNTIDWMENAGSSVYYHLHDLLRFKKFKSSKSEDHNRLFSIYSSMSDECNEIIYDPKYELDKLKIFFSKFLETTTSGFEWYMENKLKSLEHVIHHGKLETLHTHIAPKVRETAQSPSEHYLLYKKGI